MLWRYPADGYDDIVYIQMRQIKVLSIGHDVLQIGALEVAKDHEIQ